MHPTSIPVSREHRRAKTDRLDLGLLKRAFVGWLRGEAKHCSMARVPSLAEEDAKRANRERQTLSHEASRIVNRLKSSLARLGIRGFNPKLRHAAARLGELRTGEGEAVPPLSLAELRRELARLAVVRTQIREVEADRLKRLNDAADTPAHRMTAQLAQLYGLGVETADLLANEIFSRPLRDRRGGAICRADRSARRERFAAPREGVGASRQCASSSCHDAAGLALSQVPAAKRPGAMVPRAHPRRPRRHQENDDCRARPQIADRTVASRHRRRSAAGRHRAAGGGYQLTRNPSSAVAHAGDCRERSEATGVPLPPMALVPLL
jgi:hypothetical protein